MRTLVSTFSILAILSVFSLLLLFFGTRLPAPLRDIDGGDTTGFAFFVYFTSIFSLLAGAVAWKQVREAFHSRYKYLLSASALVVIAFVGFVSFVLYGLSQSTDL
jgi:hypothetical protein